MGNFAPPARVDGPVRLPVPFGLFSVVDWADDTTDGKWQNGVEWESIACAVAASGIGDPECAPAETGGTDAVGLPKDFTGPFNDLTEASAFTIYAPFKCAPVGWSPQEAEDRARRLLIETEEKAVERYFWTGDLGNTPNLEAATDLAGSAVSPALAVALLERYIAEEFGAIGVIHADRQSASIMVGAMLAYRDGNVLRTQLGTRIAVGTGYPGTSPAGAAPAAGYRWLRATGPVLGYRSDIFPASNRAGDLLDRGTNDLYAVAERKYLLGFDADCADPAAVLMASTCC